MKKKILRFTLQIHKVLGTIMFPIFIIWCLSGFVMIFHGFPFCDKGKLFNKQNSLAPLVEGVTLPLDTSVNLGRLSLQVIAGQVTYSCGGENYTGKGFVPIVCYSPEQLDLEVGNLYSKPIKKVEVLHDFDFWVPWKYLKAVFPLRKYFLDDTEQTVVYVSTKTGGVVQETTWRSRIFACFGAIPHLFYFKYLTLRNGLRTQLLFWLAVVGMLVCFSGFFMGVYFSLKSRKKKRNQLSPYRKKVYYWHHITGLFFGVVLFSFLFSGMLYTMQIPQWMVPLKHEIDYNRLWTENPKDFSVYALSLNKVLLDKQFEQVKRVEWKQIDGKPYYYLYEEYDTPIIVRADRADTVIVKEFSRKEIEVIFAKKFDGYPYKTTHIIETDGYYNISGELSVVRFEFLDSDKTWVYVDTKNPIFLPSLNKSTRLRRWLYHGLHTFDIPYLFKHKLLRKVFLVIVLVVLFIVCFTGAMLGVRYIRHKKRKYKGKYSNQKRWI